MQTHLFAPFTEEQVANFNDYQTSGVWHPFTCGRKDQHMQDQDDVLVARPGGLYCPHCPYEQNWMHVWMGNGQWRLAFDEYKKAMKGLGLTS